jgi:hypothetical protein
VNRIFPADRPATGAPGPVCRNSAKITPSFYDCGPVPAQAVPVEGMKRLLVELILNGSVPGPDGMTANRFGLPGFASWLMDRRPAMR